MIITITREFGSGGRTIAKKLAEKLGYAYYDYEIVQQIAQRFGIMSVPTMILFKKGQQAAAFSGYMPEAMLMQNIESKL